MDTLATDTAHAPYAGVLRELDDDHGSTLTDPSFVLPRIENAGWQPSRTAWSRCGSATRSRP
ncbi:MULTISPECIES: hypothetical protein [Streptomyces]|jgi:hypothetical protein|nr:hypothetical protein [Streptomyces glaucescens]